MSASSSVSFERAVNGASECVSVHGELDLTNAHLLSETLAPTAAATTIVDLTDLGFIDSAAMRELDRARRAHADAGRRLLLVAPTGSTAQWTFRIAGLGPDSFFETVEAALRASGP